MKVLCTLIVLALLTGCSSGILALESEPKVEPDVPQSMVIKMPPDKTNADKAKTLVQTSSLPPSSTTEPTLAKTTNIASTTPKSQQPIPPDPKPFSPSNILKVGSRGKEVLALEQQLTDLHYDVGIVDGFYDQQTRQAVLAFQKYNQLPRTGIYTLETQKTLSEATSPDGLYPELGLPHIEIDLTRQVLLFFDGQGLNRVIAVSSGSDRKYCEISKKTGKQVCGVARTPRGKFSIQWRIPGWRESDLGKLYNPLYFNGGFAIHGSLSVPGYNASHGCVRISVATSRWLYDTVQNGTPVIVFD